MVGLLDENINLDYKITKKNQVIGIFGGSWTHNIKRVAFEIGEEKDAIKLFVDTNADILLSHVKFRFKSSFYPGYLHKFFIKYLNQGILDDIPPMDGYTMTKFRENGPNKFCQYVRKRNTKLLKDPQSMLHDCEFLNKIVER